jgi:hypothetical protein
MLFVVPLHVKKESASSGFGPRTQAATRINNKIISNCRKPTVWHNNAAVTASLTTTLYARRPQHCTTRRKPRIARITHHASLSSTKRKILPSGSLKKQLPPDTARALMLAPHSLAAASWSLKT